MDGKFFLEPIAAQTLEARREIEACSEYTQHFGLALTGEQTRELVTQRFETLKKNGRVEFGGGILPKLIYAFCDSPFITPGSWAQTLAELQELFYYFKNESNDTISDDELVEYMRRIFADSAQGSTAYMAGIAASELETLSHFHDGDARYIDGFGRMNLEEN